MCELEEPYHAEHGEPDVGHVLRREPPVPDAQHVGHRLKIMKAILKGDCS
jgi:hypothetical protein